MWVPHSTLGERSAACGDADSGHLLSGLALRQGWLMVDLNPLCVDPTAERKDFMSSYQARRALVARSVSQMISRSAKPVS